MTTHTHRGAQLTLTAVITAALAALIVFLSAPHAGKADASGMRGPKLTPKAVAFRAGMDKLWEEHIVWTRMVIVDFAAGLPDLPTAEARLLRNQADIGNAITPYYGRAAGNQLTSLLRTHILDAVPVLQAAKAGEKAKLTRALAAWYANARQIAIFLSKANPHNWPFGMMNAMMKRHLALTTNEAVARGEVERRRRRLRQGRERDPRDVLHAQQRHHPPVPEPLLSGKVAAAPPGGAAAPA